MLFNSFSFLVFFPVVVGLFFLLPHRFRWAWNLGASYLFYAWWRADFALLMLAVSFVSWACGLGIARAASETGRRIWLAINVLTLTANLAFWKYAYFISENLSLVTGTDYLRSSGLEIILPLGISFFSFHGLSYCADVYRKKIEAEPHFGMLALYIAFWPQLVAGPIERATNLLHQFKEVKVFTYDDAVIGFNRMVYGLFKKVVVADNLSEYVNLVYGQPSQYGFWPSWLAVLFFAIQIYCDFSGYSDMAIGSARVMGYHLKENFNRPYLAPTLGEFWNRWHISLSSFFRDYVYIPLGGNRDGKLKAARYQLVTFFLSGIWHGASWNFIVWGMVHGVYLVIERFVLGLRAENIRPGLPKVFSTIVVFLVATLAWVLFRARHWDEAMRIYSNIFHFQPFPGVAAVTIGLGPLNVAEYFLFIGLLAFSYVFPVTMKVRRNVAFLVFWSTIIVLFGKGDNSEFIYFQF